jgi:hypothetical protein
MYVRPDARKPGADGQRSAERLVKEPVPKLSSDVFLEALKLQSSVPQRLSSMISTLSSVSGSAGSVGTFEHDRGAFQTAT